MNTQTIAQSDPRGIFKVTVGTIILIAAYVGTMFIFFLYPSTAVFEPPLLLPILNTIFAGILPIAVSVVAARAYLMSGLGSLLYMGCGMLVFGCGAVLAGWLIGGPLGPNINVTIYNTGALVASILHLVGVSRILQYDLPDAEPGRRIHHLLWLGAGSVVFMLMLTLATFKGLTPIFFVQGAGPTPLRQLVLGASAALFLASSLILGNVFRQQKKPFHLWYAVSLLFLSIGLIAFFLQKSVGGPIGWLGRSGQYIAGIYALSAIILAVRDAQTQGMSFKKTVTDLFGQVPIPYQVLVETSTDPIVTCDQDFRVVQWNSAAEKMFGYPHGEAIGMVLLDFAIEKRSAFEFEKQAKVLAANARDSATSINPLEIMGKTKDQEEIFLEVSLSAVRNVQGPMLYLCVFRDSTERKTAEETRRKQAETLLRESEFRWQFAIEGSGDGLWDWDVPKGKVFFSKRWKEMLGFGENEIGDGLGEWEKRIHPEDRAETLAAVGRYLDGKSPSYASEHRVGCKDGSYKWILDRGVVVNRGSDGKPLRIIGTHSDISERRRGEQKVREVSNRIETAMLGTVIAISRMLDMRDPYTAGHERRVGEISAAIAAEMGLDAEMQRGLRVAGGVHDVGKIIVPAEILSKPGKLSAIEYSLIQGHAQQGYEVLKDIDFPWPVAEVARQHHERIDGGGYPRGLKGDEILLEARILAVADVIEAMSSHRPYRPGLGIEKALAEIELGRGTAYDPNAVDACLKLFREKGYTMPA